MIPAGPKPVRFCDIEATRVCLRSRHVGQALSRVAVGDRIGVNGTAFADDGRKVGFIGSVERAS